MSSSRYNDQLLLSQIAAGSEPAFCALFDRYWHKVFTTALLFTRSEPVAQDIAQEVFLQLWQHRERAATIEKAESYLFISARNLIFKKMSRLKLEDAYQQYVAAQGVRQAAPSTGTTEYKELHSLVETAIRRLPPQQQKAFRLSREGGLSHEEISARMGVSRAAVKDYIVRSISFLRKYLREQALFWLF
ncbi:RNA polymerase sigma-70 factor [Chitinophaga horti]|uniref:RNA polymerase sigma-70 factor n=1 Tax=Chitinophaga horti TaxID=2920382 RepID=A0ABY6J7J2_9BACT|nr:RNA polymerase sigma-70 factor [Chitinophaga horti]UYQ94119.1 RNA polymerase sigma-70 factor [Chitinophaga horti]